MTISWTTGHVASGDESIYFETAGEGDTIVFSHGLGGNHAVWYQQVPVFANAFRVVTWDQRGFGRSTNRAADAGPHAAATDIGALLDHIGIERATLVGQSMGGWAVLGYALRAPERVAGLVVTDSTAGVMNDRIMQILTSGTRASLPEPVLGRHPAIGGRFSDRDPSASFLYQQIGSFRSDSVTDADMVAKLFTTTYAADDVAALTMPALFVVGAEDDLIPPAAVREVANLVPHAHFVEIPEAGHSPYFEQAAAWNAVVLSFLSEVEEGVRSGTTDR